MVSNLRSLDGLGLEILALPSLPPPSDPPLSTSRLNEPINPAHSSCGISLKPSSPSLLASLPWPPDYRHIFI